YRKSKPYTQNGYYNDYPYAKRYFFGTLLSGAAIFSAAYATSEGFRERFTSIWDQNFFSNVERKNVWKANLQMFYDHPWFGIGLGQNEARLGEYYQRLGVQSEFGGHAHNNYFQYLATTGIIGFACYMIFILTLLLATQRLWSEIPRTHFWHRVIALGALGAQVSMHVGGLTQWNFGDAEVNHMFVFIAAVILYLNERYGRGIVPDDYAL
ncbi:MAG: O-antigen ligase family protein, partial [Bdellovibrionales bacterium]|nr:O-antigen ligase family protein [Bdellovibrionales bacterium]